MKIALGVDTVYYLRLKLLQDQVLDCLKRAEELCCLGSLDLLEMRYDGTFC